VPRPRISLLVGNPTARSGKAAAAIEAAMAGLTEARLQPEFFSTLPGGATVAALAQRLERGDVARVIYLGGDGTFAETAKGIILAREQYGVDTPMGMLPMGTANDQGRSFGVRAGVKALPTNIKTIAAGIEQWLDVGKVEAFDAAGEPLLRDLWFDSWGLGLSAQILAKRNRERKIVARIPVIRQIYRDKLVYIRAGLSSYVKNMFKALIGRARFAAEIRIDDRTLRYDGVNDIVIKGTLLYGGDWIFAPDGKPDDGKFEVIIVKNSADWAAAAIGGHKRNPVTRDDLAVLGLPQREIPSGRIVEIRVTRPDGMPPLPAQIDGEEFLPADHYRIENLYHYLRILVPEDAHWV
jgi:diacylglycerol kinase family enzyme